MLLHAREGHVELRGQVHDRSVCTPELLQNPAPGGVRERGERGIEAGLEFVSPAPGRTGGVLVRVMLPQPGGAGNPLQP